MNDTGRLKWSRQAAARSRPVTTPSLMARVCNRIAIRLESMMTDSSDVIVFRAAGQVGRPVARVHVAHRHQISRPGESHNLRRKPADSGIGRLR